MGIAVGIIVMSFFGTVTEALGPHQEPQKPAYTAVIGADGETLYLTAQQ